jgi:hypothetical protein
MENYTFFKFIKIKEKQIKEKIKYLETQYGGDDTFNLNYIQLKLLKLQNQLKSIKNKSPDTLINPYSKLKIQIDEINNSIKQLQKVNTLPTDNTEILNKITELQIVLDSTPNDYNKIQANTKVAYVGEAINSEQITMIFDKYANDSNMMIDDIKKNLKENSNQLISSKEINKTINEIQTKIDEYTINLSKFIELEEELNENIKKMEQIFTFEIDENTECKNPENNDIIINVDKISKEKTQELELNIDVDTNPSELIGTEFLKVNKVNQVNNKYYKKFSEKSIDKNIINLHNEWLEIIKNYKNKLENKIKDKKNILSGGAKKSGDVTSSDDSDGSDGSDKEEEERESKKNIFDLINKLNDYEVLVRKIKNYNIKIIKLVKLYNIRYSQFFNFQKYIVNYVSLRIAEGGYSYYQYMSKGSISFFDSLLTDLNNILKKFNNYSSLNDDDLQFLNQEHIKWFYAKHYFMITILQNFFSKLYIFWSKKQEQKLTKQSWGLDKQIKTDAENSKYFFLFNIFQEILMEYYMRLPSIANYIRINKIKEDETMVVTFEKENKHNLKQTSLLKCSLQEKGNTTQAKTTQAKDISQIKFAEIFDPDNFKENDSIPYYMGLSDSLNKGKSILILTYGYSGVGKSYTLFGSPKKDQITKPNGDIIPGTDGPTPGMLQSTLKSLGSGTTIKVKMFELYGLGVPYKFYWKDPSNFCHFIYAYKFDTENNITYTKIDKNGFTNYLNIKNDTDYQEIDKTNIDNFTNFIKKIDDIRKDEGRIKSTLNNPESSRSIMIYDFKIELKNTEKTKKKFTNFVVMDLPGKEDIYQTYCENNDNNFKLKDKFKKFKKVEINVTNSSISTTEINKEYNNSLIKSMMYSNPLWLSLIPEIAEQFDSEQFDLSNFNIKQLFNQDPIKPLTVYNIIINTKTEIGEFTQLPNPKKHKAKKYFIDSDITSPNEQQIILRLRGLYERALFNMVNIIENGDLEKLGDKLNDMLDSSEAREKKYGFAGLEAIYINENILGLLQILANKVRSIKGKDPVNVVCQQEEYYKKIFTGDANYKLNDSLAQKNRQKNINENEFFSQIEYLSDFERTNVKRTISENSFLMNDVYNNKFRNPIEKNIEEIIKNYNYNKIFNIDNPPIKRILESYIDSIDNFYLFFVVTNNNKEDSSGNSINTCDKQMQLIWDTRHFMNVIAEDNPASIIC